MGRSAQAKFNYICIEIDWKCNRQNSTSSRYARSTSFSPPLLLLSQHPVNPIKSTWLKRLPLPSPCSRRPHSSNYSTAAANKTNLSHQLFPERGTSPSKLRWSPFNRAVINLTAKYTRKIELTPYREYNERSTFDLSRDGWVAIGGGSRYRRERSRPALMAMTVHRCRKTYDHCHRMGGIEFRWCLNALIIAPISSIALAGPKMFNRSAKIWSMLPGAARGTTLAATERAVSVFRACRSVPEFS